MDIKNLKKLTTFCQKNGIKRLKTADFEIEIGDKPLKPMKGPEQPIVQITAEEAERMPSEDEMLMWASPAYDHIVAQRKAN